MRALPASALTFALAAACSGPREAAPPVTAAPAASPAPAPAAPMPKFVPPETEADDTAEDLFGVRVSDPYRWLEQETEPKVQRWMEQQDAAARKVLDALPARQRLVERLKQLHYLESTGAPEPRAGRLFYLRTHPDREKAILYWREGADGAEKVLLDPNQWMKDGNFALGCWAPSWDGKKLVFCKRPNAADEAVLHVVDVESGAVSAVDVIPGGKYASPSWTPDSKGFYYEWLPDDPKVAVADKPGTVEVRFHALGADPAKDELVHPRTGNASTFLNSEVSPDGRWLLVTIDRGWSENDVFVRDLSKKGSPFRAVAKGKDVTYEVLMWRGDLYVATEEGAPKRRIFKVAAAKPDRKGWKEIVKEDPTSTLEAFSIVGGHLALVYLKDAASELRIVTLDGKPVRTVALPTLGTVHIVRGREDLDDAYFEFSSFAVPKQVYRASVSSGATALWATVEVPADLSHYRVDQVFFPSKDGTRIPMFVVGRADLKKDGNNPTLLYGYGGFNLAVKPSFRASMIPWLEAGGVFAVANLRGGAEYGKEWHDAGRLHKKQNVFDDFVAAAEHLIKDGTTSPGKLAIYGGSNGGLLVGAAMVQRPELFRAVVCAVPLLDMVRYHQFGSGRTWIPEYGTAEKEADFRALYAYSPYHHVVSGARYPAMLMLSADHDDRVDPMHARKFVAAVQAASESGEPAMLRIEKNAGHGGADQIKQTVEQFADIHAFLFERMGIKAFERAP